MTRSIMHLVLFPLQVRIVSPFPVSLARLYALMIQIVSNTYDSRLYIEFSRVTESLLASTLTSPFAFDR